MRAWGSGVALVAGCRGMGPPGWPNKRHLAAHCVLVVDADQLIANLRTADPPD
jgi:hypothetical protein